jgi:hypothetical protein
VTKPTSTNYTNVVSRLERTIELFPPLILFLTLPPTLLQTPHYFDHFLYKHMQGTRKRNQHPPFHFSSSSRHKQQPQGSKEPPWIIFLILSKPNLRFSMERKLLMLSPSFFSHGQHIIIPSSINLLPKPTCKRVCTFSNLLESHMGKFKLWFFL